MSDFSNLFNPNTYEPTEDDRSFDPLPPGWYSTTITSAEIKDTKAGNGKYIAVRYDVTGPTHQGRVVFGNFNIQNPNPKAEEIGRSQLYKLMQSIGVAATDTDQLIGHNVQIKLKISKSEQYGDGNEVQDWKAATTAGPATFGQPAPAPQAPAAGKPPWAK